MWCVASDNSDLLERTMIEVQTVAAANRLCRSSEMTRGRWVLGEDVLIVKESLGFRSTGDGRQRCSRRGGRGIQNLGSSGIESSLGAVQRREAFAAAGGCGIAAATAIRAAAATAAGLLGSRRLRAEHGVGGSALGVAGGGRRGGMDRSARRAVPPRRGPQRAWSGCRGPVAPGRRSGAQGCSQRQPSWPF